MKMVITKQDEAERRSGIIGVVGTCLVFIIHFTLLYFGWQEIDLEKTITKEYWF